MSQDTGALFRTIARQEKNLEQMLAEANRSLRLAQTALLEDRNVLEKLLTERQRVLDAIPECPEHGACVPHALEWIEQAGKALELWQRWWDYNGEGPLESTSDDYGRGPVCFFCCEEEGHAPECIWPEVAELLGITEGAE